MFFCFVKTMKTCLPLPGWRRSKRRRSSSGKGQKRRSQSAWLSWVPSQSRPTCWRRRWMRTCCSSERTPTSPITTLFILCLSGHVSVFSCKWWKLFFVFFVRVYLSVICSVVSVLEGAACLQICHCTEPTRDSVHYDNLSNKNINMFTRGLCVKFTKHSVWLVHISPQHFEPLHAVKLKVVVDVRECVSLCCGGPSRRWPHVTGGCCYLIRGCLPLYQKLLMKPCCNTLWSSQQSPELHPNKDVINIQPVITVLLATILAFKCWNSLQSVTQAFAPTCKTLCVKCKEKKKGGGLGDIFHKCRETFCVFG